MLQQRLGQLGSRFSLDEVGMRRIVCSSPALLNRDSGILLSKVDSLVTEEPCMRASIPCLLSINGSALHYSAETLLSKVKFLRDYGEPPHLALLDYACCV